VKGVATVSEKVILPKEVAEAIEEMCKTRNEKYRHLFCNNWSYIEREYGCDSDIHNILLDYARENPINYMRALVEGYEVEKTKEDRLLDYYNSNARELKDTGFRQHVIRRALEILEIKIEGINA
jgi:hypothetical protein